MSSPAAVKFETQSLQVAAFVVCRGVEITEVTGQRGRAMFHFSDPSAAAQAAHHFLTDGSEDAVSARELFRAVSHCKDWLDYTFGPRPNDGRAARRS